MKKIFLFCLLIAFVFAFSSCSEAAQNDSKPEEGVINVDNGSLDKDLSTMEDGDELSFRMGSSGTLNLSGVNLDSLFSVEFEGGNAKGTSRGMSGGNSEISRVDKNGPFILIPQASGEVSFSGSDVGASLDDGIVKLKKIGNDLRIGKNYVEYDVPPTGKDYKKEGYPEYQWPTYQNYIHIDLNSDQWKYAKDKQVVIVQHIVNDNDGNHGGEYQDNFGLIKNGEVTYSRDIKGLYDLKGKDSLNLYTFLRLRKYNGDNSCMRTYIIVPEELSSTPIGIASYSTVFKVAPNDKSTYEIRITDVASGEFTDLITGILEGRPRFFNGDDLGRLIWIKDISKDGKKMSATLCFRKVDQPFILNSYVRERKEAENLGKISLVLSEDQEWITHVDMIQLDDPESHTIELSASKLFQNGAIKTPKDGNDYILRVTNNSTDLSLRFFYKFIGSGATEFYGSGHAGGGETVGRGTVKPKETSEFILHPDMDGYFTIYTKGDDISFTYQLTEIQENN